MTQAPINARRPYPLRRRSWLRHAAIGGLMAAGGVIVGLPAGNALACDFAGPPSVDITDLPLVLESDEVIYVGGPYFGDPPGPVTGAIRTEVVEEEPESEEFFSGAIWQTTDVWGDAEIAPIWVEHAVRKSEADYCFDFNSRPLGDRQYDLSTIDGGTIGITGEYEDEDVEAALDDLFGPSLAVTDEEAEAATPGGRPSISRVPNVSRGLPTTTLALGAGGVLAAALIAVLAVGVARRRRPSS